MMNKRKLITICTSVAGVVTVIAAVVLANNNIADIPSTTETAEISLSPSIKVTPTPTSKPTLTPTPIVAVTSVPAEITTSTTIAHQEAAKTTQAAVQPAQNAPASKETAAPPPPTQTQAVPPPTEAPPPPTETQAPPPPTQAAYVPNPDNIRSILISMYQSSGQFNPEGAYFGEDSMSLNRQGRTSDEAYAKYYYRNKYGGQLELGSGIRSVNVSMDDTYVYISTTCYALNG